MKTVDQVLKIKATVLYILGQMPEGVDYLHLFKMMYFAQQDHLVRYGLPLMEDTFCARKHGPVPKLTYKVLRGVERATEFEDVEMETFRKSVRVEIQDGHQVFFAVQPCDMEELSRSDIKVLGQCIDRCREVQSFELASLSHDKAWNKAKRATELTGEDTKIPLYDIAKAGGATGAMLAVIRDRQRMEKSLS